MPWRPAYLRTRSRKKRLAVSSSKTCDRLWLRQVQWLVEPRSTRSRRGMRGTPRGTQTVCLLLGSRSSSLPVDAQTRTGRFPTRWREVGRPSPTPLTASHDAGDLHEVRDCPVGFEGRITGLGEMAPGDAARRDDIEPL